MKAKSIYAVLASLMLTTGLVACGPETNPTGGNTGGGITSSPTTQAPEVKKGTVVLSLIAIKELLLLIKQMAMSVKL